MTTTAEASDETDARRYPFIMTTTKIGPRYAWRLAVGPFDATGHTFTYRGATRQIRRTAELFALCATLKNQWHERTPPPIDCTT
jgi:hypothetical protein